MDVLLSLRSGFSIATKRSEKLSTSQVLFWSGSGGSQLGTRWKFEVTELGIQYEVLNDRVTNSPGKLS